MSWMIVGLIEWGVGNSSDAAIPAYREEMCTPHFVLLYDSCDSLCDGWWVGTGEIVSQDLQFICNLH
jgi:hypothetical protein